LKTALSLLCIFWTVSAFAQSDRGALTGTVSDPTGSMVPAARIVLRHVDTGTNYETVSTDTGNYTLPSLPVGAYKLIVEHPGFNRHEQTGIRIQVAVTARLDIQLKVGQVTESVEVTSGVAMLKTESAEQSTTVTGDTINALPINFGIGAGAIRNPLSFVQLTPGATMNGWNNIRVNGTPAGTFRILFEGQESSRGTWTGKTGILASPRFPRTHTGAGI
jgi:Carboxypeptidase regulatory-like domain